jgi:hypothetical protein
VSGEGLAQIQVSVCPIVVAGVDVIFREDQQSTEPFVISAALT